MNSSQTNSGLFVLLICLIAIPVPDAKAGFYTATGTFSTATWPWYAPWLSSQQQLSYNGVISDNLTTGGGAGNLVSIPPGQTPNAVIEAIAYPTAGALAGSSFNMNTLLYSAVGGNWATYTGSISLEIGYYESPNRFSRRTIMTVVYSNGIAQFFVPFSKDTGHITGGRGENPQSKTNPTRLPLRGEPVQIPTGAEVVTKKLFSFHGARDWSFSLAYNNILAQRQFATGPNAQGWGWTHSFEKTLTIAGANLLLQRGGGSESLFVPDPQSSGRFISADDNARDEKITTQTGGGWLLVRRDQSSLLFNSAGQLIEDCDPHGHKLVLTHTGGLLRRVADPISNTSLDFGYNGNNYVVSLTDANGNVVSWDYYPNNPARIKTLTNQRGKQLTFSYDTSTMALLTIVDDSTGASLTTNNYDNNNRVISQDDGVSGNQSMVISYDEIAQPGGVIYAQSDTAKLVPLPLAVPGQLQVDSFGLPGGQLITYTHDSNGRLASATVGSQVTTLSYDAVGNVISVTDPAGATTPVVPRTVSTITDRNGKRSVYTFDSNYNQLSVTDELNHTTSYTYDAANRLTSATDPLNRTSSYTYDPSGNVLTFTDAAGHVTTNTYDVNNNLLTTIDALAHVVTRTYDTKNNLVTFTDALGRTTSWTYDGNSLPLTMILPSGGVYHYTYINGRLSSVSDPNGVVTNFGYDANGRLLYREDALGKRTAFSYDGCGNVLTVTNALNQVFTYVYDQRNRVTSVTNPTGAATHYTYDANGNLLTATDALGKVTTYTYDGEDRLATKMDAIGNTTTYAYDDVGHLASVTVPGSGTTVYSYDAAGQLTVVTDPAGKTSAAAYDARGLLISVTDPLSRTFNYTYDDIGRRITAKDPLNRTTGFEYDAVNRLKKVTDPGSLIAEQGFDVDGNRTTIKNPASAVSAFAYDAGKRLTMMTTSEGHSTSYTYNSRGLLSTTTKPSGQATALSYDDAHRLTGSSDSLGGITLTRDDAGRVLAVVEGSKTIARVFDALGRLTSYTDGDGNTLGYTYDDVGRLTKVTYPGTPLKEVSYAYDAADRLSTVTDWAGRTTTYSYDALSRVAQIVRPNGTKQARAYDDAGQLTLLKEFAPDGITEIYSGTHVYDTAGQLTGETIAPSVTLGAVNVTQTFSADNRLLTHNSAVATFDADGNLLSVSSGVTPSTYSYDPRNRLISAGGLTYGYNAENRRVSVTSSGGTTAYVVNPNAILDQVLVRVMPDGTKTFYVYGLGLLHEETGANLRYYHFDRRGDTIAITDATGNVTDRASYGVYGELLSHVGTTNTPFLFNGEWGVQTDSNGIYFHRARYYHPQLRRFLNQDSVVGELKNSPSLNRFAYANGNPISLIDPFGLRADWGQFGRGAASFAGAVIGTVGLAAVEVGSGGLATAGVIVGAGSVGTAYVYGIGNMVAAFSDDPARAKKMADAPSSVPQIVARVAGGENSQNVVGVVESLVGFGEAKSAIEFTRVFLEYFSAGKDLVDSMTEGPEKVGCER